MPRKRESRKDSAIGAATTEKPKAKPRGPHLQWTGADWTNYHAKQPNLKCADICAGCGKADD